MPVEEDIFVKLRVDGLGLWSSKLVLSEPPAVVSTTVVATSASIIALATDVTSASDAWDVILGISSWLMDSTCLKQQKPERLPYPHPFSCLLTCRA